MSALGLIHRIYRGGEIHVLLRDPVRSGEQQRTIWEIAKQFGGAVSTEATKRRIPLHALDVWTAPALFGLVGKDAYYWVFCYWPSQPRVHCADLDAPEPPSVDALLAGLRIPFADPLYAFRVPLTALGDAHVLADDLLEKLVGEYFDYRAGIRRRAGDESQSYVHTLAAMASSSPSLEPPLPGWRVGIRCSSSTSKLLVDALTSLECSVTVENGRAYLRAASFSQYTDSLDVVNHANQLLHLAAALIHLWAGSPGQLSAETAELVSEDGSIEGQLGSADISAAVWSRGGKEALTRAAGPTPGTLADNLLELAHESTGAQRVLKLVAQTDRSWGDLFTTLELIASDVGGIPEIGRRGWARSTEIERFCRTANTTELGRHGRDGTPSRRPMLLPEARVLVFRIARAWLVSQLGSVRGGG